MWQLITISIVIFFIQQIGADSIMGPGIWSLIGVEKCPIELEEEVIQAEVYKHKINRTHDGINAETKLLDDIGDNYGGLVEICKFVDGGCKPYQVISDNSVAELFKKYIKQENIVKALILSNVDPPDFPIPKGEYRMEDFIMDYCKMHRNAIYGRFEGMGYLMRGSEKVSCVKVIAEFNRFDDNNYCD